MEVPMNNYIGIDVAKSTLQVYIPENELNIEIENSLYGLKKLYNKLNKLYKKTLPDIVFVYESTGSYSTILERYCQANKIKCFKVGAYQSSSFSKVIKNRSKTDKIDAKMLSQMNILAKEKDIKIPVRDDSAHKIRSFIKYYHSLIKEEGRVANYLESATFNLEDKYVLKRVKNKITNIQKEQLLIVEKAMELIKSNDSYYEAYTNITSIKGVGQKSAIILLYLFLKYPNASRQHITALSGLDPIEKSSGTSVNRKQRISKQGLSLLRAIMYMPVLTTIQHNEEMRLFYNRLLERGKPKMLAQMAVMRKMILLAHSLYKNKEQYDSKRYLNFTQNKKEIEMK
ncbi:IS110 family transposase [Arcobacter sp. F2176]|nr:IS110 family transposase [Arcobacter sp. F2176]